MRPFIFCLCILVVCAGGGARGQDAGVAENSKPVAAGQPVGARELMFRRVFVPADRVADWPIGNEPYVPVPAAEFERALATSERETAGSTVVPREPVIVAAHYVARFDGLQLSGESGQWQIERPEGAHEQLSIRTDLAIDRIGWLPAGSGPERTETSEATLGFTNRGRQVLLVPRSATLSFAWSKRATSVGPGRWTFDLHLPASAANSLELRLPHGLTPQVAGAIVTEQSAEGSQTRWHLELGRTTEVSLILQRAHPERAVVELPAVRPRMTYDLSPRGLELTAEFDFSELMTPLAELELVVDEGLSVLAVETAGAAIPWSRGASRDDSRSRFTIRPPTPWSNKGIVRVNALAPIAMDQAWRLPKLSVAGMVCQEGRLVCRILAPLLVRKFGAVSCRQIGAGALPAPLSGEQFEFESFAEEWSLTVDLARQPPVDAFTSATSLNVAENDLLARTQFRARLRDGQLIRLNGEVGEGWVVESVEALSGAEINNWLVDRSTQPAQLRVALDGQSRGNEWLELRVHARKLDWVLGKMLAMAELVPVRFQASLPGDEWISLALPGDMDLQFADGMSPAAPAVDPAIERLFPAPISATHVFHITPRTANRSLTLAREQPGFSAQAEIAVTVGDTTLREDYAIRCTPAGGPVDRCVLAFVTTAASTLEWPAQTNEGIGLVAHRLDDDSRELWEIQLAKPQIGPFSFNMSRVRDLEEVASLALASVEDAHEQRASVSIAAPVDRSIDVQSRGARPVSLPSAGGVSHAVRANYEYQPQAAIRASEPPLTIAVGPRGSASAVVVWTALVSARCHPEGSVDQEWRYYVENSGAAFLTVPMPAEGIIDTIVNGRHVDALLKERWIEIPLPANERYAVVALQLRSRTKGWGVWNRFAAELPDPLGSTTTVRRELNVAIPRGYTIPWMPEMSDTERAPSLAQRLFGVFGREPAAEPLRPGNGEMISRGSSGAGTFDSEMFYRSLGRAAFGRESATTWGEALQRCADELFTESRLALVVDQAAAASLGLGSDTKLPQSVRGDSLREQARTLMNEAGLGLVERGGMIVVTRLGFEDRADEVATGQGRIVAIAQWGTAQNHPWFTVPAGSLLQGNSAWKEYHFVLPDALGLRVPIVDARAIDVAGWLTLLVTLSVSLWVLKRRRSVLWALLSLAIVVALVVPAYLVPVGSALVLGLLVALGFGWARGESRVGAEMPSTTVTEGRPSSRLSGVTAWLVLSGVLLSASHGAPQPRFDDAPQVLIPADANGKPSGDVVYIPQPFWQELQSLARNESEQWMLSQGRYRGELQWDARRQRVVLPTLEADFQLDVFEPHATIHFPFSADSALGGWSVQLDGQTLDARFDSGTGSLSFAVPETGRYQLQVRFAPVVQFASHHALLESPVPSLATNRVELAVPPDLPLVEFPAALGGARRHEQGRSVVASLGAVDRLSVEWKSVPGPVSEDLLTEVDQLLWLRVRPGSVTLDAKFHFVKPFGMPTFEILADRRLRYMPAESEGANLPEITKLDDLQQSLVFALPGEEAGLHEIRARFSISDRAGLGQLTLPRLDARNGQIRRRWLAVSLDPTLTLEEMAVGASSVSVEDFVSAWRQADARPDRVYLLSDAETRWSISTRPLDTQIEAEPRLTLIAGQQRVDVRYQAALKVTSARLFQHRLQIPPELHVQQVSVATAKGEQATRWSKNAEGEIAVFLNALPQGEQMLQLSGWIDVGDEQRVAVPRITLPEARVRSSVLTLARQPDTLITFVDTKLKSENATSGQVGVDSDVVIAGQYRGDGADLSGTVEIRPNRPRVTSTIVTRLDRANGGWKATVDCELSVDEGALDVLRFTIPSWWKGPFQSETEVVPTNDPRGSSTQELMVRLPRPLDATGRVRWEGVLNAADGEVKIPQVTLAVDGTTSQFIALPTGEGQRWQLVGLRRTSAPAFVKQTPDTEGLFEYYECFDANSSAVLLKNEQQQVVEVLQQSVELFVENPAVGYGVATIDIAPNGRSDATLVFPQGSGAVQVLLDGRPAMLAALVENRWKLALRSDQLPQRIEAMFVCDLPQGPIALLAPRVESSTAVAPIAWRLRSRTPVWVESDATSLNCVAFDLRHLQQCARMLEQGDSLLPGAESQAFVQDWLARAKRAERRLTRSVGGLPAGERERALEEAKPLLAALKGRFDNSAAVTTQPPGFDSALAAWNLSGEDTLVSCYGLNDATAPLVVSLARPAADGWWRLAWAALVVSVAFVAWRTAVWRAVGKIIDRWPLPMVATIGLLWWAFLQPGVVGLALLLVPAGVMAWRIFGPRASWPRRASSAEPSSRMV